MCRLTDLLACETGQQRGDGTGLLADDESRHDAAPAILEDLQWRE
jgi:hypothetical protein